MLCSGPKPRSQLPLAEQNEPEHSCSFRSSVPSLWFLRSVCSTSPPWACWHPRGLDPTPLSHRGNLAGREGNSLSSSSTIFQQLKAKDARVRPPLPKQRCSITTQVAPFQGDTLNFVGKRALQAAMPFFLKKRSILALIIITILLFFPFFFLIKKELIGSVCGRHAWWRRKTQTQTISTSLRGLAQIVH